LIREFLPSEKSARIIVPIHTGKFTSKPKYGTIKQCVSLLEYAVFGFPAVTHPTDTTSPFHVKCSQRIETVAFLLERGAPRKQVMLNGKLIIDEVRNNKIRVVFSDTLLVIMA
jgi:hypothetical protein